MHRGTIPAFGMNLYGPAELRQEGILVVAHETSMAMEPRRMRPHYHDFFQILLVQGGGTLMHDFRDYKLAGTSAVFVSPGQVHTLAPGPGVRGSHLSFTQGFFDHKAPPPSMLFEMPFFFPADAAPSLRLPDDQAEGIVAICHEMQQEFDAAQPGAAEALRSLLMLICVRLSRIYAQVHPTKVASRGEQLVREFQLAVEHRFKEMRSVKHYAQLLQVTPNHLNDVLKAHTGHSAGEHIHERQLLNAKRLLLHSDLSVSEIGYQMGFQDPSYFSRFFRRTQGSTPADFRLEIREKYQRNER